MAVETHVETHQERSGMNEATNARWGAILRVLARCCRAREPFNGISHLAGAVLSVAGLLFLTAAAAARPWHLAGFIVYGVNMVLL